VVDDSESCVDGSEEPIVAGLGEVGDDTVDDSVEDCLCERELLNLLSLTLTASWGALKQIASVIDSAVSVGSSAQLGEIVEGEVLLSEVRRLRSVLVQIHTSC
jgi:hypothetical protein